MSNTNSSGPGRPADDKERPDSTERSGQGQSGYGAGRRGEDPAQRYQNRNETDDDRPRPGEPPRPDDRPGLGLDDRFTGRRR
jgi:hypothetical protein